MAGGAQERSHAEAPAEGGLHKGLHILPTVGEPGRKAGMRPALPFVPEPDFGNFGSLPVLQEMHPVGKDGGGGNSWQTRSQVRRFSGAFPRK